MGRFAHEAVAIDPRTGVVYQTEDDGNDSGFYRFRRSGEAHYWDGNLVHLLQNAVETDSYSAYKRYSERVAAPTWILPKCPQSTCACSPGKVVSLRNASALAAGRTAPTYRRTGA